MMTRNEAMTATLEQLTDELAAAGWDSTQQTAEEARDAVLRLIDEIETSRLQRLADKAGYERVEWDSAEGCYVGFGSSDPTNRSRDNVGSVYLGTDLDELEREHN